MKKQKSGLYRSKIVIGSDLDGKPISKWISGRTQRELEEAKREVITHYIAGQAAVSDRLFGEYAVMWFRDVKSPGLSPSSVQSYRTALNKDILPVFGERQLRAISATDLQSFVNGFIGMSATKITVICAALSGLMESACADGIIAQNPMDHVRKPKATPAAEKTSLRADQRAAIERVCAADPRATYLALLYYLGVRQGEARGIQWGDIDWDAGTIHIQRDIDSKDGCRVGELKTAKSNRIIPMPDQLRDILMPQRGMPSVFMAHGERGGALSKSSAERLWCDLMVECGMAVSAEDASYPAYDPRSRWQPLITPHTLRHDYASRCWEHGLDAYTAMRLLGHASIKTTMDIYTHLSAAQLERVSANVREMFSGESCTKVAQAKNAYGGQHKKNP